MMTPALYPTFLVNEMRLGKIYLMWKGETQQDYWDFLEYWHHQPEEHKMFELAYQTKNQVYVVKSPKETNS